jgi:molybdopterin-guanine dinucleotide biosynthesis protein A
VLARLRPQCADVAISANGDPARFASYGAAVVVDDVPDFPGPLAGILVGLDYAWDHGFTWLLSTPVDTPFLPADLAVRLQNAREAAGASLAVAVSGGQIHPVVALWPVVLRADLRDAITIDGVRRVERFVTARGAALAEWPAVPHDPFFNVNTPEDVVAAEGLIASGQERQ